MVKYFFDILYNNLILRRGGIRYFFESYFEIDRFLKTEKDTVPDIL